MIKQNKLMKNGKTLLVLPLLMLFMQSFAQAQDTFPNSGPVHVLDAHGMCAVPKIDGDKVPFPLRNANTKYELAENETYLLNGVLSSQDGKVLFKIDFDSQPWLATQKRTQFPYFLINTAEQVAKFNGSLVQMAVVVRKNETSSNGQEYDSAMTLDLIASPVLVK